MEVINELKELDSLHNEWKTVGTKISNEELASEISGESDKDLFYFDKMKNHISFVISKIKEHKEHSILNKTCCEKKIDVKLYDGNLIFKGFIDKLWYNEESNIIGNALLQYMEYCAF